MSKPEFATNRNGERVADALKDHLGWVLDTWKKGFEVAIASAYFNAGGFSLLAEELERVESVRLLLGVDPDEPDRRLRRLDATTTPAAARGARLRDALSGHVRSIEEDRDLLGFNAEADASARRLVEWLRSGRVEVRRYERGFLHGKAFMVTTDSEGVIAGSSNFTFAGLARNRELNLGRYEEHVVGLVREWFEELWSDADPYDLAALYEARFEEHNPHLVYLRMLLERYGGEVEAEAADAGRAVSLTTFQNDGVWRARRILERRNGVLIADGVGLGKTYIAGELIREGVRDRRQRVLVVAPAALRDGPWAKFLLDLGVNVEVVSYEELSADDRLSVEGVRPVLRYGIDEYAMVVIDEAHAYRHPETIRAGVLRALLQGSPPKKLVLLTATPVNNGLMDLYYLLSYFVRNDAAFADAGITSLREHFREAVALDPEDLSPERLFDVLDAVAVRRTRHFVKRYYPHDTIEIDGEKRTISFPKPRVRTVKYDLEDALPGFFDRFAELLRADADGGAGSRPDPETEALSFARYTPSAYRDAGETESFELNAAGLLRTGLLKRFESSSSAFAHTCRRMAASHDEFLSLLDQGHVATGPTLAEWAATDSDEIDEFEARFAEDLEPAADFRRDELREAVERDRDLLLALAQDAELVTPEEDPKLDRLCEELAQIASEAREEALDEEEARNKRKVIVFTYYTDTVEWIEGRLRQAVSEREDLAPYRGRMSTVTGDDDNKSRVLQRFAPVSSEAPGEVEDEYDLLISTDVVAEGVNLQQARHVINYDLPWNPMRLVQRHGRIDRIGSRHDEVFIRCFLPDRQIDALLGLEKQLHDKIRQAAATVGVETEVLPGSMVSDHTFAEKRDEIERLRNEEATIFEEGGETGSAYSGEEYRQELRAGLQNPALAQRMRALPWGSGSGKAGAVDAPGFVFCARVGDHPRPQFRYVAFRTDDEEPDVVSDTLACLAHAHAGEDTARVLDEATHQLAYDAWAIARTAIYEEWQYATDPSNLAPTVPKAMRDAARLVREHPPSSLLQAEIDQLVEALEAPYGERFQRPFRAVMREHVDDPAAAVDGIQALASELGLEPPEPPEALPVIEEADVNLVCWLAIVPEGRSEAR